MSDPTQGQGREIRRADPGVVDPGIDDRADPTKQRSAIACDDVLDAIDPADVLGRAELDRRKLDS